MTAIDSLSSDSCLEGALPLFTIGCPRSGTTLLARVLNSHPAVLMTNETAVFLWFHQNITKSREGFKAGLTYGKEHHALWANHLEQHAKALIESYYEKVCTAESKHRPMYWGEKHPHMFECLEFVSRLYPDARYIYIIRDPRDVACSVSELINVDHPSALQGLKFAFDRYEAFAEVLIADRMLRIRYEDLVADYHAMAVRIFAWLGLEYAPEARRFVEDNGKVDSHSAQIDAPEQIDFQSRSVGRWRRGFSEADRLHAEELFGDFIKRYGYGQPADSGLTEGCTPPGRAPFSAT